MFHVPGFIAGLKLSANKILNIPPGKKLKTLFSRKLDVFVKSFYMLQ